MSTTIEDIQYLKKHGRQESYLFLVESSLRNKAFWPTPSEYVVDFKSPFRHVYGVDVLDGYIPRTQYRVSERNNRFTYSIGSGDWKTLVIDPANYEIEQLVREMNTSEDWKQNNFSVRTLSNPEDLKEKVIFTCPLSFSINASVQYSAREVLGFANPVIPARNDGLDIFESERTAAATTQILNFDSTQLTEISTVDVSVITETFSIVLPHEIHEISLEAEPSVTSIYFEIQDADETVYDSGTMTFEDHYQGGKFVVKKTEHANAWNTEMPLLANKTYSLIFRTPEGETMTVRQTQDGNACVGLRAYTYQLIPPGLYNLTGERFVQLRCREIEQYLYRTRVYDTGEGLAHPGLAKFQLGLYGSHEHERFDYRSFPPRDFHPIGKLSSLTFRFECNDGTLYDFKGIDHNMTIVIRYWAVRESPFETRILNPHYNANFLEYMQRDMDRRHDSEDEN